MRYAALILILLAGCELNPSTTSDGGALDGGGIDAGYTGTGALSGGLAFTATSTLELHVLDTQGNIAGYQVAIADHGLTCGQLEALDGGLPATGFRDVVVTVVGAQGQAPTASSYQVVATYPPNFGTAAVTFVTVFPDGGRDGPYVAQSGQVTLTTASDAQATGNFDVQMPAGNGSVTELGGTFDAPYCP